MDSVSDSGAIAIGDLLADRYEIESVLGRGGLATVYRARDTSLGRVVALKVLDSNGADATAIERGRSEIELLASLSHHALVTLFDAADVDGRTVLVMELVDGPDLGARLARGPLEQSDIVRMAIDLAEALHTVHERGIVHRDIKPGNVLLAPSSLPGVEFTAKLADFGIAYLIDSTRITATGTLIGTAAFLSPEQARGAAPGAPSDIYSLGLVVLESLTGKREFTGSLVESVAARLARDPVIPVGLDADWRELLTAMTAREPADRPTALDVALAAREIAVSQHVTTAPTLAFTAVMDEPTALLTDRATRVLDASPTEQVSPRASVVPVRRKRRWPLIAGVAAAVIIVGGIAAVAASTAPPAPAPETVPTLPALDDPLGAHLDELLEAVTQ
jgi:eukaryotic-like serine/threonine-protein kinase